MNHSVLNSLLITTLLFSAFAQLPVKPASVPLAAASSTSPSQDGPVDSQELEAFIDSLMAGEMETNRIPGAVVSVVKDGQVVFNKGYGYSDYENAVPVDPERTLFRVGSVSKLLVWTAVMQLFEQGRLSLDADINTYLDFQIPATYPQPITMKNLMSHTAGFEYREEGCWKKNPEELISLGQYIKTDIPRRVYPPGKIAAYSNYGAALAGYIVERLSGMPFSDYAEKYIFTPLGLVHTTFRQPLPAGLAPDLANGYHFAQGKYVKAGFEYLIPYPAGALSSTGADMARFMLAHLQNGQLGGSRILAEQTARQMHSQLFTHDPRIPGMAYGFYENRFNGQRILSHGGATINFYSKLYLIPDRNTGVFISTNAPGGAGTRETLFKKFMDRYYPAAHKPVQAPEPGFSDRIAPYLGAYYNASSNFTTAEKLLSALSQLDASLDASGHFIASAGGQTIQALEVEPGLMRDKDNANVEFVLHTDEDGQAYLLTPEPSPWIKTPWYGTLTFHALLIGSGLLLFLVTLTGWGIAAIIRLRRCQPATLLSHLARWTGVLFTTGLGGILAGWVCLLTQQDPAFGTEAITFGLPPLYYALYGLGYILAGLGALMLIFAALAWVRHLWSLPGRLHYSLLVLCALSLLWALWYWNLL